MSGNKFCIGNKVKLLNESGEGVVKNISGNVITILIDGWIEEKFSPEDLVLIKQNKAGKNKTNNIKIQQTKDAGMQKNKHHYLLKKYLKKESLKGRKKGTVYAEIDLHLENLVEFPNRIENANKINIQVSHFKRCFAEAIELKIQKLIVIHGIGEGVLKSAIRDYTGGYENVEIHDASYKKYGRGATEIIIKGIYKK